MALKDREYETILKGCKEFQDAVTVTKRGADLLAKEAQVAQGTLKDSVSQKNIEKINELVDTIRKVTAQGEERIRELEQRIKKEKDDYDELDR